MSRAPLTFRRRDIVAAVKAIETAGLPVARVEICKDGKIVVIIGSPATAPTPENEWDSVLPPA
jgi:hypothetical protein